MDLKSTKTQTQKKTLTSLNLITDKKKGTNKEPSYCLQCGSLLGQDCGDAEPDYNDNFCSKICYENMVMALSQYYSSRGFLKK